MSRNPVFGISDQVRHKRGYTTTEDDWWLEISDLEVEGLYYLCSENKGADQLRGCRAADLHLCFLICKNRVSHDMPSDSGSRGRGFEPHSGRRVVSLSKAYLPPKKVLVIPRKRWLRPNMTEKLVTGTLSIKPKS